MESMGNISVKKDKENSQKVESCCSSKLIFQHI
jgi:hypothetical protein